MAQKIHYQAVSRTFFVAAAVTLPFSAFSQPLSKTFKVEEHPSVINTVAPRGQTNFVFSSFSQPLVKKQSSSAWINNPVQIAKTFSVFTQFSLPSVLKNPVVDEQPSPLFEIEPPSSAPFTGFLQFSQPVRFKGPAAFEATWTFIPFIEQPDTHDGVFVDHRKKRKRHDLIEDELARKAKLRADIELAIYGPDIPFEVPDVKYEIPRQIEFGNLASIVANAQHNQYVLAQKKSDDDDETDFEELLKDIL